MSERWLYVGAGVLIVVVAVGLVRRAPNHVRSWWHRRRSKLEQLPRPQPPAPGPSRTLRPDTWELVNDEARHLLEAQRSSGERVETKAALVIGAALTLAQFVAREPRSSYWLPAALGGYALSIVLGLLCVRPRHFDTLGLEDVMNGVWWYPRGHAAAEMANNRNEFVKQNARRHKWRVRWFWASLVALAVGAIISTAHLTWGRRTNDRLNGTCIESAPGAFVCTADP